MSTETLSTARTPPKYFDTPLTLSVTSPAVDAAGIATQGLPV